MAKKRKLEPKPAPLPEPESEPEEEEEEEEEDDPAEEEPEEEEEEEEEEEGEEDDPAEEELEEEEEEDDLAEEESEEEEDDDGEEDSSHSNDEYPIPNPNGSTAVHNANPNGPTPVDPTSVRDLLAPLSKDQLISLLTSAAVSHPSALKVIQSTAEDSSQRNIFVDGLSCDITSAASLYAVFSKYGTVEDVHIGTDKITGKSKGYAFVLFQTHAAAQNALKEPQKKIGSRMANCKLVFGQNVLQPPLFLRKIYVDNVPPESDPGRILEFFRQFGEVEKGPLGLDEATGKSKGIVLVYKTAEGAKRALEQPQKSYEGHLLHCSMAIDGLKDRWKIGKVQMAQQNNNLVGGTASPAVAPSAHHMAVEGAKWSLELPHKSYGGHLMHCSRASNVPIGTVQMAQQSNNFMGGAASPAVVPPAHHMAVEGAKRLLEQPHKSYGEHLMHCSRSSNGPIGTVQMAQQNNNFVGGAASPAVAPPAHNMAARTVPTVGVGYNQPVGPQVLNQPVGPQVLPVQTTNAALGQAVGQALTALGFGNLLGGLGGVQAPAVANPMVPPVQGGYTAGMPVQSGYAAGAPVQSGYAAGAPVQGGYATRAPVQEGYAARAPMQGGYVARAPMQGGYAAGAPVRGGYTNQGMGQARAGSRYPGGIGGYGIQAPYR